MKDIEYRWTQFRWTSSSYTHKRLPYEKCPNCGKYELTVRRKTVKTTARKRGSYSNWLLDWLSNDYIPKRVVVGYLKKDFCENCKLHCKPHAEVLEEWEDEVEIESDGSVKILDKPLYVAGEGSEKGV